MKYSLLFIFASLLLLSSCSEESNTTNKDEKEDLQSNLYSIPGESLNGWDEGIIQYQGGNNVNMYCVQKTDSITGDVHVFVSSTDNSTPENGLMVIFGNDGSFQMATYKGISYVVENDGGKRKLVGYDKKWDKVQEVTLDNAILDCSGRTSIQKVPGIKSLASSRASSLVDVYSGLYNVWDYGFQYLNWENNSDRINTFVNLMKAVGAGAVVSAVGLSGIPAIIASAAVINFTEDMFNVYKASMYGRYIDIVITNVDLRNHKFTVEIMGQLRTDHTYQLAVVGRNKRALTDNRVDYTRAEYRTETITISNNKQSYVLTLNKDLENVGEYIFVPYLLVDDHAQDKYITMRGWFAYYGKPYTYNYPNPIIQSIKQNKCTQSTSNPDYVDFDLDFNIDLDSYVNVKDIRVVLYNKKSQIAYGNSGVPSKNEVTVKVEGTIEKSLFDKNNELLLDYAIIAYGNMPLADHNMSEIVEKAVRLTLNNTYCPDDHHPHAIDLGLPSGIKWCCMNVGASSPEQPGGYYAWGETSEKSVYDWYTYQYYNRDTWEYIDIGSDIAGTSYDVAHVRMGGSWRMPSRAQIEELMDNCTRTWTQQNGVNGILVTGKNGGRLFLPAAGWRSNSGLDDAGSGSYWSSSSPGQVHDARAHVLYFYSGDWHWDIYLIRDEGLPVRAVCP